MRPPTPCPWVPVAGSTSRGSKNSSIANRRPRLPKSVNTGEHITYHGEIGLPDGHTRYVSSRSHPCENLTRSDPTTRPALTALQGQATRRIQPMTMQQTSFFRKMSSVGNEVQLARHLFLAWPAKVATFVTSQCYPAYSFDLQTISSTRRVGSRNGAAAE